MRTPQLPGDIELVVQPLMNEHKVKKYFERTDPAEEVKPQETQAKKESKEEVNDSQPKANHRKDETNTKKNKRHRWQG